MISSRRQQQLAELAAFSSACDEIDDCADELCLATSSALVAATGGGAGGSGSGGGTLRPLAVTPTQLATAAKRCSSNNLLEKRKRSLAHSSDDEVRHLLEHQQHHHHHHHHHHQQPLLSAPVNFRTSPPLEALKPHRGHIIQRSTTPLILTESGRGLEHIRISSSSSISSTTSSLSSLGGGGAGGGPTTIYGAVGGLPTCDSPSSVSCGISSTSSSSSSNHQHHQHHHHHHHHHHQNTPHPQQVQTSNNLALLSTTNNAAAAAPTAGPAAAATVMPFVGQEVAGAVVSNMEISRSVSPPAKVFHCAVSPRRRQSRHQQQRLQRPHRPCLDFDKMQQVSIYRFDAIPNSRFRKCAAM